MYFLSFSKIIEAVFIFTVSAIRFCFFTLFVWRQPNGSCLALV